MRSFPLGSAAKPVLELLSLDDPLATDAEAVGAKAAALARARAAGLPALPGFVLPVAAGAQAMRIGRAALAAHGVARRAVSAAELGAVLAERLRIAVDRLGGRVIVRSSSPLEADPRWAGAFSSLNEVDRDGIGAAVRSCWASAFGPDPLRRLEQVGLGPERLELAVLIQPELRPVAGGTAQVGSEGVRVTGIRGHPGALLTGWAEGATALIGTGGTGGTDTHGLVEQIGESTVARVVELALAGYATLGDDVIEWAAAPEINLLQCGRSTPTPTRPAPVVSHIPGFGAAMRVPATGCAPGEAVGRLVYARPHEPIDGGASAHILVCDRPLPAFAPLLFGARAVVCLAGAADSHLAQVARSLGVPMLVQTPLTEVTGPLDTLNTGPGWLGAVDGARGELALVRRSS